MSVEVESVLVTFSRYDLGCFQLALAVFRSTPAPVLLKEQVHPLMSLALLQST